MNQIYYIKIKDINLFKDVAVSSLENCLNCINYDELMDISLITVNVDGNNLNVAKMLHQLRENVIDSNIHLFQIFDESHLYFCK